MPVLTLDYRHCDRKRPKFIKHVEIEAIAALARQQLVGSGVDAIAFDTLRQIDRLKINGIDFALEVSTDCEVHDEDGNHVFGICEYDPYAPDTAMVCVSPVGEKLSELLALSTLAHELGHFCDPKHPPITEAEAEAYLARDLQTALAATLRYCPVLATEPESRIAAIVDFTFNLGAGRLQTSTLRRRINQRDWSAAATELRRWVYGGGKVLPGLFARREAEISLLDTKV